MAITTTTTIDTNAGTHNSGSITLTSGDIVVVFGFVTGNGTPPVITDSHADGFGTYSIITGAEVVNSADKVCVYIRDARVGSTASATISATGQNSSGGGLVVVQIPAPSGAEWTGVEGLNLIRQYGSVAYQTSSTTPIVTFSKSINTNSVVLGAVFNQSNAAAVTPPSGYTESVDTGYSTPTAGVEVAYKDTGASGTTVTWGSVSPTTYAAIAVEIYPITEHTKTHQHHSLNRSDVYDDCYYYTVECWDGGIKQLVGGSGGVNGGVSDSSATYADKEHPGVLEISTGTHSNGYASLGNYSLDGVTIQTLNGRLGPQIRFGCIAKVPTLSVSGGEQFGVYMGISSVSNPNFITPNGSLVMFGLSSDGSTITLRTMNGTNYYSQTLTPTQDTNWHTYEWIFNPKAQSVTPYIDGVAYTAVTSYIPSADMGLMPCTIFKGNGTAARVVEVDAYWYQIDFPSTRTSVYGG